jgi:hypothetical protein
MARFIRTEDLTDRGYWAEGFKVYDNHGGGPVVVRYRFNSLGADAVSRESDALDAYAHAATGAGYSVTRDVVQHSSRSYPVIRVSFAEGNDPRR